MTCDIVCTPTPFAPGYWTIDAGTDRGRQWWIQSSFPEIGWQLGAGSFAFDEVKRTLLEMPGGMTASLDGRQLLMVDQEGSND